MRRLLRAALLILGLIALAPVPASANTRAGTPVYFRETGHTLAYSFREFYDAQGGLPIFGLPLTEVFIEDGRPVQYFERARLEWHGDLGLVQAGHLGRLAAESYSDHPAFARVASAPQGGVFFDATGHTLAGPFLSFWRRGSLDAFGFPISEPFEELNGQDGRLYTVQYFERARFELHPEISPASAGPTCCAPVVLLGHLGRQHLDAAPPPEAALSPVDAASRAWDSVRPARVRVPRIGIDTAVVSAGFSLGQWDVPRHTAVHYWPIAGYPGTPGNIVLAGHVGYPGEIFNRLPAAQPGDEIFVTAGGQERRYIVHEVLTLLPTATWVMAPTHDEQLTLITCVPIGVYSHRLIVRASPG
ncbi:MAG: sortase [Chloroflexales bacterium]|nr:sortase [Chloroflexales bacterium]